MIKRQDRLSVWMFTPAQMYAAWLILAGIRIYGMPETQQLRPIPVIPGGGGQS